jgi:hypothetical protein
VLAAAAAATAATAAAACRTRLQQLAANVAVPSSEQLSAAAAARRPKSRKNALAGLRLDDGIHVNSVDSRPAKKTAGAASVGLVKGASAPVSVTVCSGLLCGVYRSRPAKKTAGAAVGLHHYVVDS